MTGIDSDLCLCWFSPGPHAIGIKRIILFNCLYGLLILLLQRHSSLCFVFFKRSSRLLAKINANDIKRLSVRRLPLISLSVHGDGFGYTILAVDWPKCPPVHKNYRYSVFQRCSSTRRLLLLVFGQSFFQLFKTVFSTFPDPFLRTILILLRNC